MTCYIALVNITGCVKHSGLFVKSFVVPAPTTNRVTHVHIHHTPRSKHCLLVRIAEIRENLRNLTDAFINMHEVSLTGKGTILLTRFLETGSIEALTNFVEIFLRDSLRHKLSPRLILNLSGEVVNCQFILRVAGISTTIHQQRNTERNTTDIGHTLLKLFTFFLRLLTSGNAFSFCLQPLLTLFIRHSFPLRLKLLILLQLFLSFLLCFSFLLANLFLPVRTLFISHVAQINGIFRVLALLIRSLATILTNMIDDFRIHLIQFILVIEAWIVKALTHQSVDKHIFQLLVDVVDIHWTHLAPIHRKNRTKLNKVTNSLLVTHFLRLLFIAFLLFLLLGCCHRREFGCFCYNLQGAVGRKVEYITFFLDLTFRSLVWRLHTEDGLHVSGSTVATLQIEHCSPRRNSNACSQTATGYGDGRSLLWIVANRFKHLIKCILVLLVCFASTCYIHNIEVTENLMLFQKLLQSCCFVDMRNYPKCMTEHLAIFIGREWKIILSILFAE